MSQTKKTEQAIDYLQKSITCYKQLLPLVKEQKNMLLAKKHDSIDEIINKKEKWLKKIKLLDQQFITIKGTIHGEPYTEQPAIKQLSKTLTGIIQYLVSTEEDCRMMMSQEKIDIKEKLWGLYKGKKMISSYFSSHKGVARFIDIKN